MHAETVQAVGGIAISNSWFINNTAELAGAIECDSAQVALHEVRVTLVATCFPLRQVGAAAGHHQC